MAQQLANGKQQFIDGNGNPLAGGSVAFYSPGTLNPVNTWQDSGLTVLNANPVTLDANGMASIWGADGTQYRQIVKDASGNTIWDEVVGLLYGSATSITYTAPFTGAVSRTQVSKNAESVSVLDFGADPTGVADSTAAFTAAIATAKRVFMPGGTYSISNIAVTASCPGFYGDPAATVLKQNSSTNTNAPLVTITGKAGGAYGGFIVQSYSSTTESSVYVVNAGICDIQNITIQESSFDSISLSNCNGTRVHGNTVLNPAARGIYLSGCQYCEVFENQVNSPSGTQHNIQSQSSLHSLIRDNVCVRTSANPNFCISLWQDTDPSVLNNVVYPNTLEGINAQDTSTALIAGNKVFCASGHHDFGISIYALAANCSAVVEGNYINGCGKAGVALASTPGTTAYDVLDTKVMGNTIINPCQNQLAGEPHAALYIYGDAGAKNNVVQNNTVDDGLANVNYVGYEAAGDYNIFKDNTSFGGAITAEYATSGAHTQVWELLEIQYTPTISAGSGTITTASASAKVQRRGTRLKIYMEINITTNGTGATSVVASFPYTATGVIPGRENAVSGKMLQGVSLNSNSISVFNYDGSYPGLTGAALILSGEVLLG